MRRQALWRNASVVIALGLAMGGGAGATRADEAVAADPHAAHRHMMETAQGHGARRTTARYEVPSLPLLRDDGERVLLDRELDDGRPVILNFIFTTCTTICPVTSHVFSMLQHKLGADSDHVHLVSISIDPEQDTPARLRAYAARFRAGASWQHYTGSVADSIAAQRAFDVYLGDKTYHQPVTLLRAARGGEWVRFDGFATPDDLLHELQAVMASAHR